MVPSPSRLHFAREVGSKGENNSLLIKILPTCQRYPGSDWPIVWKEKHLSYCLIVFFGIEERQVWGNFPRGVMWTKSLNDDFAISWTGWTWSWFRITPWQPWQSDSSRSPWVNKGYTIHYKPFQQRYAAGNLHFTPGQRFSLANFNLKLTQQSLPLLGFLECNTLLTHAAVPLCFSLMVALLLTTSTFPLAFASHRFTRSSTDAPPVNGHHSILVRNP